MSRCDYCVRVEVCVSLIRGRSSRGKKGKNHIFFLEIGVSQSRFSVCIFTFLFVVCVFRSFHFILFLSSSLLSVRICLQVTNYNRIVWASLPFRFLISFAMKNVCADAKIGFGELNIWLWQTNWCLSVENNLIWIECASPFEVTWRINRCIGNGKGNAFKSNIIESSGTK